MRLRSWRGRLALLVTAFIPFAAACGGPAPAVVPNAARLDLSVAWVGASPSDVGLDERVLAAGMQQADSIARVRCVLVARHGRLVAERYFDGSSAQTLFDLRSVTKTVVSALTGIALRDHVFASADTSIDGYLAPAYALDTSDAAVSLGHLLTMSSGFEWNEGAGGNDYNQWIASGDRVQYLLDRPHSALAGSSFTYNSAAVHVLGVALQRAANTSLPRYADDHLLHPLGIDSAQWESLDRGTVNGGSGIKLRARDALKVGQLYLQQGWSGEQSVVPAAWVAETTQPRYTWRQNYGAQRSVTYGMLWWVSDASPTAFFAWGYGGQFVYVVPSLDLVVFTATDWSNLGAGESETLANQVLGVIVQGVVAAAR